MMREGADNTRSRRAYLRLGLLGVTLMVQYYTLEQAAQILRLNPEQLKEMARKKEIRAFQDRSGWRFRAQEIDEMARERGYGSDPELPLGEAAKAKSGDSGGKDVFNFSLDVEESDEVPLGKEPVSSEKPSRSGSGSRSKTGSAKSPPPKASSDSDVRLVLEGGDMDLDLDAGSSKAPASKGPISPKPKVGSSKSRGAPPAKDDSGVRIVPLDQPSDSNVKITPSSPHDSDIPGPNQPAKRPSDSDIRIEAMGRGRAASEMVTEEIDLDAEQRKVEAARPKAGRQKPKPGSSPILPTTSPFELSENDIDMDGPTIPPPARAGGAGVSPVGEKEEDTDSSSDFELKPMTDSSSPLEPSSDEMASLGSDDEVSLGELTGGKGASGINLQDPADSGISLEQPGSDEMDLELSLDAGSTPKPAPVSESETDSSSDFELSLQDEDASPTEGSSSEFELSLQDEDASPTEGSSSEFELSLDAGGDLAVDEGSSELGLETPGSDSDSEFELTLDEGGGLSVEEEGAAEGDEDVLETDFEVPSLDEESGSEAVALDEGDTDLESSEFDLSLEGEESGSQVVPLEDEEEYDEGAATVQRKAAGALTEDEEGLEDIGEALDEDLDEAPELEEEGEPVAVAAAPPPAEWGVLPALVLLPTTILLFVVGLMSFELIQGMWGYHSGNKVSNMVIHPIAKMFDDSLPEN
jgi:excisionase family DNA binding protein